MNLQKHLPSIIAATIIAASRRAMHIEPIWNDNLTNMSKFYDQTNDLYPCFHQFSKYVKNIIHHFLILLIIAFLLEIFMNLIMVMKHHKLVIMYNKYKLLTHKILKLKLKIHCIIKVLK